MKTGLAIEDLAAEVMRENSVKLDYVVNSRDLRMETWHNNLFLRVLDSELMQIDNSLLDQISNGINKEYDILFEIEQDAKMQQKNGEE